MLLAKKSRKKALIESKIVVLILIMVSLILLFGFLYKLYAKSTNNAAEQTCRNSIVLVDILADKIEAEWFEAGQHAKPWPATCKTQDKIINVKDTEKAKKELAELMANCWWMMGEGEIKPFDLDMFHVRRKCFVCYTATFPKLKGTIDSSDFMFYLREKGRKGVSYYDYFKYEGNPVMKTSLADPVDNKRVYSIIYMSPNDPAYGSIVACLGGASVGSIIPAAAGGAMALVGTVGCGIATIKAQIEAAKDDVVYVADINRGISGCEGDWISTGTRVQSY